ncbi:MAG TPA: VWA domain-containing protein [Longimicrobiales bacterium]|nr:VWA domain-containing protein [Longimicrobiales bacterium]
MSFTDRPLLALAVALPIVMAFLLIRFVRRRRAVARALGEARLLARLGGSELSRFPRERFLLLIPAALALGIAAAGPHWGIRAVEGESRSLNVVLALDISKSMLARDVSPSRLERERLLVRRLLRDLAQERIGLVVFAGRSYILAPLTNDQSALNLFVDALAPDIVSQGGSSVASAVSLASDLARGPEGAAGERAVILVSDGEALDEGNDIAQALDRARRQHVKVFTVAIGTRQGAPVPDIDPETRKMIGYKKDPYGATVISKMDPTVLREVAQNTGGQFYDLGRGGSTDELVRQLRKLQRTPGTTEAGVEPRDQTPWFIAIALLLLAADYIISKRGRPKRSPKLTSSLRPAVLAALLTFAYSGNAYAIGEVQRGNRYYRSGHYAEAVQAYEKAIAKGDNSAETRYNLGTAYLRLGKYEDAEKHLRLAMREMKPEVKPRAFYNLGNRYLESARKGGADQAANTQLLDAAVEAYKQSLRLQPKDMDAKWNLELALREKEKQNKSPSGGQSQQQPQNSDDKTKSPSAGGGSGNSSQGQSSAGQGRNQGQNYEQRPLSQEQADRILSAVEQDERQLTKQKLRKGQQQTPVTRDW